MIIDTNIKEWINKFENGEFNNADKETQIKAGWLEWKCEDFFLKYKTEHLGKIISRFKNSSKLNLDKQYIWFVNDCIESEKRLYDQFKIADWETPNVLYCVDIDDDMSHLKYSIYGNDNEFLEPLFESNNVYELIEWFNN